MNQIEYSSVSELNQYLYYKFETDQVLKNVYIEGELSNVKKSGKHYYFSLKDAESEISAMMFYPANLSLTFNPQDGMKVQVIGRVQVYQKRGTYSIVVNQMNECGVGLLYQRYLELKAKLQAEGLFDPDTKLPIPDYPEHVGIITAETGEAINDIVSTFNRRFPLAKLTLFPAIVQGLDCPKDLVRALNLAYQDLSLDVIIIGRGGGSYEDLNGFNDETLARTLFASRIPTVSAVGHEGDYTICDFVCSFRAPTPTGAAMRLTKEKNDVSNEILNNAKRLSQAMKNKLINDFNRFNQLSSSYTLTKFDEVINNIEQKVINFDKRLELLTPEKIVEKLNDKITNYSTQLTAGFNNILSKNLLLLNEYQTKISKDNLLKKIENYEVKTDNYVNQLNQLENHYLDNLTDQYNHLLEKTIILNPLNLIKKGYSIVYKDDEVISKISDLNIDDQIKIKFADGVAEATIINKNEE